LERKALDSVPFLGHAFPLSSEAASFGRCKGHLVVRSQASMMGSLLHWVKVASVIHHGAYSTLSQSYQTVLKWVEANGYQVHGPIREIYLQCGETLRQDDESYVTEIQVLTAKI
jgi:GyrI-like small molecule binding domain